MITAATAHERWVLRLFAPLLGWAFIALALWKWLGGMVTLSPEAASLLTLGAVFITSSGYIFLACRDGEYPRRAWWIAFLALVFSIGIGFYLQANLVQSILFLLAAPLFGDMLSRLVEKKEYLLPVFTVAVIADAWSVFWGPSRAVVETGITRCVAVCYPVAGYARTLPIPVAGITDWIFFAFFVCIVVRFDLPRWKIFPAAALGIVMGLIFAKFTGSPFPLLATLAPAFGIFYFFEILPSRREIFITLTFLIVMLAIFAAVGVIRGKFKAPPEAPSLLTRPGADCLHDPAAAAPPIPQSPRPGR